MYLINKHNEKWDVLLSFIPKMWRFRWFRYRNYPYKKMLNVVFLGFQFRIIKYCGWYEVSDKQLFLHNVTKWLQDVTISEVKSPTELKQVEEAIENGKDSDEIAEERQEIFFIKNGRMPERDYDF